jgi:hypothetical protein
MLRELNRARALKAALAKRDARRIKNKAAFLAGRAKGRAIAAANRSAKAALKKQQAALKKTAKASKASKSTRSLLRPALGTPRHLITDLRTSRPHLSTSGRIVVPLKRGTNDRTILTNIRILVNNGWDHKQALRTALTTARKSGTTRQKNFKVSKRLL